MLKLLYVIPLFPFLSSIFLIIKNHRIRRSTVHLIAVGSLAVSMLFSWILAVHFIVARAEADFYWVKMRRWMSVGGFSPDFSFYLDSISLVMILVITSVGFLIHLYSVGYMAQDRGYKRFFAYMNLFIGFMLILVLADDLLFLYLGWEGVGLCSYLLIGFWYDDIKNGFAARKAFLVTRVGDAGLAIGLFFLFSHFHTLEIQSILKSAAVEWAEKPQLANIAAFLILMGAVGKSAQLPLQIWLPDAMAGPTPVSALIHAATMVTAGVYLIARMNPLFALAPMAQSWVAWIGAVTLLLAGFSAWVQTDIKKVLAYSTMSQMGYLFLALGVGAWSAALFHLMTHAFFKSLLFLSAGVLIQRLDHEQNMMKMGGLRKQMPFVFIVFLIGASSLVALPFVTAGFYSKDLILLKTFVASGTKLGRPFGNTFWLWIMGILGAFFTAIYTFRMVFLTFFGEAKTQAKSNPMSWTMCFPLSVLAFFSIGGGFIPIPEFLGDYSPAPPTDLVLSLKGIAGCAPLLGIGMAYVLYRRQSRLRIFKKFNGLRLLTSFFGLDTLYAKFIVHPYVWVARLNSRDFLDQISFKTVSLAQRAYSSLSLTQTGKMRLYVAGIVGGAALAVAFFVLVGSFP